MFLKRNMSTTDRIIRILIAVILGVLYFSNTITGVIGGILLILGVILLLTSFVGFCPLYAPFGFSTSSKPADDK